MKRKKLLCALLCAALVLPLCPPPAGAVTLTAVNDTLLPLDENTMPTRLGGELYVPYSVFTSLGVSALSADGVLNLSANGETLSFSTAEGYVYDQNLNSYSSPPYEMNGTVYVPVKLCCGKFGLGYSTLNIAGETVLRVTDSSAQSDSAFTAAAQAQIESTINTYNGTPGTTPNPPPAPSVPKPSEQPPPVEETPTHKPAQVYLAFLGAPTSHTGAILDALRDAKRPAAFFLPADSSSWQDDDVRRIVGEGHTAALLLNPSPESPPESLVNQLTAANEKLALLTGMETRIICCADGTDKLTAAQRNALTAAGYRLWNTTLDSGDETQSAEMAYAKTAQYFSTTSAVIVLRLHHTEHTADMLRSLTAYMSRQGIPTPYISLSTTPV